MGSASFIAVFLVGTVAPEAYGEGRPTDSERFRVFNTDRPIQHRQADQVGSRILKGDTMATGLMPAPLHFAVALHLRLAPFSQLVLFIVP